MNDIRSHYSDMLKAYNWDYFFTVTFRSPRREPYYAMKHVWSDLQKHHVGRAFMGVEPFVSGDLHIHGLLSGRPPGWLPEIDLPWDIWDSLFHRFGRSKVEACNSPLAVASYCSKYVLKAQSSCIDHYDFFGDAFNWKGGLLT